jgi:hypothetical protein
MPSTPEFVAAMEDLKQALREAFAPLLRFAEKVVIALNNALTRQR